MTLQTRRRILLTVAIATFPLFLLTLLLAFGLVNPMGLVFLTSFQVVNETDELVHVTPIGAVGARGDRRTLPHSASGSFYVIATRRSEFPVPPNSSRTFTYDWDDIQFSEILIRRPAGGYVFITTGLDPVEGQYRHPERDRFVINDLDELPEAEAHHLSALPEQSGRGWIVYILAGLGLLSPVFFSLARKMKTKAARAGEAGGVPATS